MRRSDFLFEGTWDAFAYLKDPVRIQGDVARVLTVGRIRWTRSYKCQEPQKMRVSTCQTTQSAANAVLWLRL